MCRIICLIVVFCCLCGLYGQAQIQPNDSIVVDTIFRKRTVEKVQLYYGPPYKYLSLSAYAELTKSFWTEKHTKNVLPLSFSKGLQAEYVHNALIVDVGLAVNSYKREYQKTTQVEDKHYMGWNVPDTVDWYAEVDEVGAVNVVYVIDNLWRDTTFYTARDSVEAYKAYYKSVSIPVMLGVQLFYGFWNFDVKAGLRTEIFLPNKSYSYRAETVSFAQNKPKHFNGTLCDLMLGVAVRYMFSYRIHFSAESYLSQTIIPLKHSNYQNPLSKSAFSLRLNIVYMLKSFDKQ